MNKDRIDMMNERLKDSKPQLDVERAKLVTEAYEIYADCTPVLRRAHAFAYILDNMDPNMQEENSSSEVRQRESEVYQSFPEFGAKWVIDEIDMFPTRGTDPIVVTPETKAEILPILESWGDNTFDMQSTAVLDPYVLKAQECGVLSVGSENDRYGTHLTGLSENPADGDFAASSIRQKR